MDGGVPWAPDPSEAMDSMNSMQGVISMGDVYQPQTIQVAEATPIETVVLMHNLHQPQTTNSMELTSQTGEVLIPSHSQTMESMETVYQQQIMDSRGECNQHPTTDDEQQEVHHAEQTPRTRMIETPEHVLEEESSINLKDVEIEANQYFVPCGEAFDLSQLYVQNSEERVQPAQRNADQEQSFPVTSERLSPFAVINESAPIISNGSVEIIPTSQDDNSEIVPQLGENSKMGEKVEVETEGGLKLQGYLMMDEEGIPYVMSDSSSPTIEDQMRAIHGPTPSPVLGISKNLVEDAPTSIISQHDVTSIISPQPDLTQVDMKSPEETATVIMDEMLKNIFNGGDDTEETGVEDAEVATIMEKHPENNFVNVSQFVINQSIPLKFDPITGEMVPDIQENESESGLEKEKTKALNEKEFLAKPKNKNVAKIKPSSHVAKVKPLPPSTPLQMMTIVSSTATHSSVPRSESDGKCSCSKHSVLGYPPSAVVYWQVRTTPGIRKTIMDFDNAGVKFLYDDGCLKAFETVLRSFKPEFQSAEKSLEVKLCLSCVRWAEGEAKERNKSPNSDNSPDVSFRCYMCPAKVSTVKQFRVHLETSHAKNRKAVAKRSVDTSKHLCECKEHNEIYLAYSRIDLNTIPFTTNFDRNEVEVKSAIRSLKEKGLLGNGEIPLCSYCIHFANSQNTKCVCIKHKIGGEVSQIKVANFERMSRDGLVLGDYYEGVSICKQCLAMSKKSKEKESVDGEEKRRKRGRPPTPEGPIKVRTSSTETENVYKKKYNSRRSRSSLEDDEPKKEEGKQSNVLMYDLYCDIPGCNARLRGYPSLIKHFKSKHPADAGTPEETINFNDKAHDDLVLESSQDESEDEADKKYLTFVKDPSKKLKAISDMPLLYIKVKKLKDVTVPSDYMLHNVKSSDKVNSGKILGKRKSVEFKEGESLTTIHTISPRRKHDTRRMDQGNPEMLATVDLNSPPKPKIIKHVKDVPNQELPEDAKTKEQPEEVAESDLNLPKSQMIKNVPKLLSPEKVEVSSSESQAQKENIKVPKVMLKAINSSPSKSKDINMSPISVDKKQKQIDKLRIDMVPEAVSPMRASRSTRAEPKTLETKSSPALKPATSPIRADPKTLEAMSPPALKPAESPMRANRSTRAVPKLLEAKSPPALKPAESPLRASRSAIPESRNILDLKKVENKSSPSRLNRLHIDMVPGAVSPMRASRSGRAESEKSDRGSSESEKPSRLEKQDEKKVSKDESKDVSSISASRPGTSESKNIEETKNQSEPKSSPSQKSTDSPQIKKLRIDMVSEALSPRRESRSIRTATKDLPEEPRSSPRSGKAETINRSDTILTKKDDSQSSTNDAKISRRTRNSLPLEEQKSPSKSFGEIDGISPTKTNAVKNTDNKHELIRKRENSETEIESSGPLAKVTRSGKRVADQNPNDDLAKVFADIEAGAINVTQAAKEKGFTFDQMHKLYRDHKMTKIKGFCVKIKTSNKIKEKYLNSNKPSNSVGRPRKEKPSQEVVNTKESLQDDVNTVEPSEEAANTAEPSQEDAKDATNVPETLQDRTTGFNEVKEALVNHLSLEQPLGQDDKKSLLEIVGIINTALLKNL